MLRSRIIPCLLIRNRGLVKTTGFGPHKYVGDPLNAVRIFNEKEVDELIVLDIDASAKGLDPDMTVVENLARECRMPLCYGGGIHTVDQAVRLVEQGVEKVAISSAAVVRPGLISEIADVIGSQSVVFVMDVKKKRWGRGYEVYTRNGSVASGHSPAEMATIVQDHGVGEIVVNSIDRDGGMEGYDYTLIDQVIGGVSVPVTALGGAGSLADIEALVSRYGIIGAAAGSLFVFKGSYRAVLISYPSHEAKEAVLTSPTP